MSKLDKLFSEIAETLKTVPYATTDIDTMRDAIRADHSILIAAGLTADLIAGVREQAAKHGIEWTARLRHDLTFDILFTKLDEPKGKEDYMPNEIKITPEEAEALWERFLVDCRDARSRLYGSPREIWFAERQALEFAITRDRKRSITLIKDVCGNCNFGQPEDWETELIRKLIERKTYEEIYQEEKARRSGGEA